MTIVKWVPWFVLPLIFFYLAGEAPAWFPTVVADKMRMLVDYNATLFSQGFTLPSDKIWNPTTGQMMILFGVIILAVELIKATQSGQLTIVDHMLSVTVFIFYFAFFLSKPWAKSDVFVIIAAMSFLDVIAGLTITIAAAKRDISIGSLS
jgi:hypothetical protein